MKKKRFFLKNGIEIRVQSGEREGDILLHGSDTSGTWGRSLSFWGSRRKGSRTTDGQTEGGGGERGHTSRDSMWEKRVKGTLVTPSSRGARNQPYRPFREGQLIPPVEQV